MCPCVRVHVHFRQKQGEEIVIHNLLTMQGAPDDFHVHRTEVNTRMKEVTIEMGLRAKLSSLPDVGLPCRTNLKMWPDQQSRPRREQDGVKGGNKSRLSCPE